jgi:hypothetical protein
LTAIRFELQSSEREQLERFTDAAVAAKYAEGAGAVLSGAGAVLAPFGVVLSGVLAAWIAKEGIDEMFNWLDTKRVENKSKNDTRFQNEYAASGSKLSYADWLEQRKQQGDYRRWKWFQDNGLIAQIRKAWGIPAESTEPTSD